MYEETIFEGHWPPSRYLYLDIRDFEGRFYLIELNGKPDDLEITDIEKFKLIRFKTRDSYIPTTNDPCVIPSMNTLVQYYSYKKSLVIYPKYAAKKEWSFDHLDQIAVFLDNPIAPGVRMLANASRRWRPDIEYVQADGIIGHTGYRMDPAVVLDEYSKDRPFTFNPDKILELQVEIHNDAYQTELSDIGLKYRFKVS